MAYWMVACSVYSCIVIIGVNIRICRRPGHLQAGYGVLRQRRQTVAEANDGLVPVGAVSASVDCPGSCYLATPTDRPDVA
jgi:hypothetical protein